MSPRKSGPSTTYTSRLAVDVELAAKQLNASLGRLAAHLEPHGAPAFAAPELGLKREQEIVGFLVVDFDVEIAGDAKRVRASNAKLREDLLRVPNDEILERHERAAGPFERDANQAGQRGRHLDQAELRLRRARSLLEDDRDVDALVADVRKWMSRIDCDRREHREDVLFEMLVERGLLLLLELVGSEQRESRCAKLLPQALVPDAVVLVDELVGALGDRGELLIRGLAVRRNLVDLAGELRLEPRDAHHEELVEVRSENRRKLQPLVERNPVVGRLGEDARVELEPGKLPVDEQARVVEPRRYRRDGRLGGYAQK